MITELIDRGIKKELFNFTAFYEICRKGSKDPNIENLMDYMFPEMHFEELQPMRKDYTKMSVRSPGTFMRKILQFLSSELCSEKQINFIKCNFQLKFMNLDKDRYDHEICGLLCRCEKRVSDKIEVLRWDFNNGDILQARTCIFFNYYFIKYLTIDLL